MSRQDKEIADKILALALAFILVLEVIPLKLHAADIAGHDSYVTTRETSSAQPSEGPLQPENKKITVTKSGNGKVTINGKEVQEAGEEVKKGEKISLKVEPEDEKTYIKSLKINGKSVEIAEDSKFQAYSEDEYVVNDDVNIEVEFMKTYTVTVDNVPQEGGEIKLSGTTMKQGANKLTVDAGSTVDLSIKPQDKYSIRSISVGNESKDVKKPAEGYKETITVNSDITINVEFEKLYTLEIKYDKENGTVTLPSDYTEVEEGVIKAVVSNGSEVKIKVEPKEGYRVSKVVKMTGNDNGICEQQDFYEINKGYEEDINVNNDYTYEFTFASNEVKVEYKKSEYGEVELFDSDENKLDNPTSIKIGSTVSVKILPKENYTVDTIKLWEQEIKYGDLGENTENIDNTLKYMIENINKDVCIAVSFKDIKTSEENLSELITIDVEGENNNLKIDDVNKCIYTSGNRLNIKSSEGNKNIRVKIDKQEYGEWSDEIVIEKDCIIKGLQLRTPGIGDVENLIGDSESIRVITNCINPTVKVKMYGEKANSNDFAENGYYTERKAIISVTEKKDTFDKEKFEKCFAKGVDWSWREPTNALNNSECTYTADLQWQEANYEWGIDYINKADMKAEIYVINDKDEIIQDQEAQHIWKFTVDNSAPTGKLKLDEKGLDDSAEQLKFDISKNKKFIVSIEASDNISGIDSCYYYKQTCEDGNARILNGDELDDLNFIEYDESKGIEVDSKENGALVVYAKIKDKAGNCTYISTNGVVMDKKKPNIDIAPTPAPGTKLKEVENGKDTVAIYDGDVKLNIKIDDSKSGDKEVRSSGIKEVQYAIITPEQEQEVWNKVETFEKSENDNVTGSIKYAEFNINVDSKTFNADGIKVKVKAIDNAGNEGNKEIDLNINKDNPTVELSFEDGEREGHFSKPRKATITYTDRDSTFDKVSAKESIKIEAKNSKENEIPQIGEVIDAGKNEHKIKIEFSGDANYTLSISGYKNKLDKELKEGKSCEFTVDSGEPNGKIVIGSNEWDELDELQNKLTFGTYINAKAVLKIEASDDISAVKEVSYYLETEDITEPKTKEELEELESESRFIEYNEEEYDEEITLDSGIYVIYARIEDATGNVKYIGSDGVIVDDTKSKITLKPEKTDKNGIYNKDVRVGIEVKEPETYSGIKCIKYWVQCDGRKTQGHTLYNFNYNKDKNTLTITDKSQKGKNVKVSKQGNVPSYSDLKQEWQGNVVVDSKKNNSSDLFLYVKVEDNAGNTSMKRIKLDIDVSKPKIEVSYDNNEDNGGNGYFKKDRTATIKIRERKNHFNAKEATAGIKITAVNGKGKAVKLPEMVSKWTSISGDTADETVHVAKIKYSADANYTFKINYTDKAGNKNSAVDTGISKSPYKFTVDKKMPVGAVTAVTAEGRKDSWSSLAGRLTFGIWSKQSIKLSAVTDDATSPVAKVMYYKTDSTKAMTRRQLAKIKKWKTFRTMSVGEDEQFTVYLKIIDKAGNENYISTNGMIVDDTAPRAEAIAPEVTVTPEQPVNGIYSKDVNVGITVSDPVSGGTYSGLKTVSYRVLNMGEETQSGVLYSFDKESPLQNELQQSWSGGITVNSSLNNSNDVVIEVYAEDNSLNSSTKSEKIKIDTTKPLINVSYDNNLPDSGKYYKGARTATIVISERNFDAKDVEVSITNTDGTIPVVSGWTTAEGNGNMDNTTHTATVTYEADGDYTFDINYTDLAGNICDGESYAPGTENPVEFTIDKILPEVSVSYNNNSAANGRYFKEARTATVTVREHNFDAGRVQFTQTAVLNGTPIASPVPSWSSNGDIHTATILYTQDGDYTFDVSMSDMAGNQVSGVNYGSDISAKEFTVDTHIDAPVITGIEDGKAYKGDVVPEIDFSDINYNNYKVTLTRTRMSEKNVDVTEQFIKEAEVNQQGGSIKNSIFDAVQENDGIYNLTVHTDDKAGNESETSVVFTLNRFGSVYAYDDYLISLIQDGGAYVKSVDNDLVVTEYNADRLVDGSLNIEITHDGKPINDIIYETSPAINSNVSVGDSGWFEYVYTVSKANFAEDGIYKMSVSSRDEAGNNPENTNYEDKDIRFCVDTAAPELTSIVGLDKKVVNATQLNVKYDVYDTIGLKSVKVYVDGDLEGSEITDFSNDYNNYSGDFTLKESGTARKVRFVVEDLAGNITDTDSEDFSSAYAFTKEVTVSTNAFIRWYANKKLFWGTIVFAVVAVGGISGIIVIKRRKKNQA